MSNIRERFLLCCLLLASLPTAAEETFPGNNALRVPPGVRGNNLPGTVEKGNFLAVPIPTSNPTTGTGLIATAGYFWGQSEQQKAVQPPSFTGVGGMYTDSESWAIGIAQTAYWHEDTWRFTAAAGVADLNLPLLASDALGIPLGIDWEIDGVLAYTQLSRRILEDWYLGLQARYIDIDQTFSVNISSIDFELAAALEAGSLGPRLFRDTRDSTTYPRTGSYLVLSGLYTRLSGSGGSYRSFELSFSSYHDLHETLVLAWRAQLCERGDDVPLWDACKISLRGFPTTDYMGSSSEMVEAEARWQLSKRWGVVGFLGAGQVHKSLSGLEDSDNIPSYGVGLRFMVNTEQRINLRLDYGRSNDSDAIYFFVGESF